MNRTHQTTLSQAVMPSIIKSILFFEGTVTITSALFSHASEATVTLVLTVQ